MYLGDLGKGWFNINQKKYELYEIAKLLRFMELVKHRMQVYKICFLFLNVTPLLNIVYCLKIFIYKKKNNVKNKQK